MIDEKTLMAQLVLESWLDASNITHESSEGRVKIPHSSGAGEVDVCLSSGVGGPEGLPVDAADLRSTDLERAIKTFHKITRRAGYGEPCPVDRGPPPPERVSAKQDLELVAFRHREFRGTPNFPPERYEPYLKTLSLSSGAAFRRYRPCWKAHGLDLDDLKTFALVWTTNFLHRLERKRIPISENRHKLSLYLRQRFWGLFDLFQRRGAIERDPVHRDVLRRLSGGDSLPLPATKAKRRADERRLLKRLKGLPQEEALELLAKIAEDPNTDEEVKETAERIRLQLIAPQTPPTAPAVTEKEKICPRCGADGEIEAIFGWRRMKVKDSGEIRTRPQSYCRDCRSQSKKNKKIVSAVTG